MKKYVLSEIPNFLLKKISFSYAEVKKVHAYIEQRSFIKKFNLLSQIKTFKLLLTIISYLTISLHTKVFSQNQFNNFQIPNLIYYDANSITLNKNTETLVLDGDATFLLGNSYMSAKKIIFQKNIGLVTATGDVKLINNKQKAVASKIIFDINTKQMRMDNAQIFSDPTLTNQKVSEETLGLSKAEIAFDIAKISRTKELENELKSLREEYVNLQNLRHIKRENASDIDSKINELINKYSRLLARLTRTQYQPNAILASLPEKLRNKLIERRSAVEKFNRDNPEIVNQIANFSAIKGYVQIAAAQIIQKDQNTFILNSAIITPCKCSDFNEPPIYGFSTQNAYIEVGDYITMRDVTVDLFSIPIFYTPWMKFPIKDKRETGFLIPSGYMSNNAGQAITIPFFVTLGPYADSTATYEYFSQRGSQFSGEFRIRLEENSIFKTEGKFIKDKTNQQSWEENNAKITQALQNTTDPSTTQLYNSYRGTNTENRWYSSSSINIPIMQNSSIKANGQFVSDNNYLSDFSNNNININPIASVFGDTSPASRRFLNQEIDTEYYGENFVLSARGQGLQDLFSQDQSNTPIRMPRIEFHLLPDHYFDFPVVFSNETSWENIARPNGSIFIPVTQNIVSPQGTNSPSNTTYVPGGQRNPNDPYAKGNRFNTSTLITLPLKANDYINANISLNGVGTQYYFPDTYPYHSAQPYLGYLQYGAHLDVPIYGKLNIIDHEDSRFGNITQNFKPFVDFNYIPDIIRSNNFPNTYQLWYAQDNPLSNATLTLGATTSWTIQKEGFQTSKAPIMRLTPRQDTGVANIQFFTQSVKEKNLNVSSDSNGIFQFSSESEATKIFESWAKKELNDYSEKISAYELKQNYIWPEGNYYQKEVIWSMTPLSLTVSTGYNLIAEKTAKEANFNAGPTVAPIPVQKYTDILASGTINLSPIIPIDGTTSISYSQYYDRINSISVSTNANLPYGLKISYTNNQQYVLDPVTQNGYIKKTQESYGVTYLPLNWLQFNYQWAQNTDPTAAQNTDFSAGRGYASTQNISLMNIQDCLDIIFARNKPAGIPEKEATYVISLNLKMFGFERKFDKSNW